MTPQPDWKEVAKEFEADDYLTYVQRMAEEIARLRAHGTGVAKICRDEITELYKRVGNGGEAAAKEITALSAEIVKLRADLEKEKKRFSMNDGRFYNAEAVDNDLRELEELRTEVTKLREERDEWKSSEQVSHDLFEAAMKDLEVAQENLRESQARELVLREALNPFAECYIESQDRLPKGAAIEIQSSHGRENGSIILPVPAFKVAKLALSAPAPDTALLVRRLVEALEKIRDGGVDNGVFASVRERLLVMLDLSTNALADTQELRKVLGL